MYDHIRENYNKVFEPGQRIRFTEYKGDRGLGVVLDEGSHGHYVRVLFDDGHEGNCHPLSVVHLAAPLFETQEEARDAAIDQTLF